MEENIWKWNNWKRINLQNIQEARVAQYQKNKESDQKIGQWSKQMFLQQRHTNDQQTHEKILNIPHC